MHSCAKISVLLVQRTNCNSGLANFQSGHLNHLPPAGVVNQTGQNTGPASTETGWPC
jgi:hypothetical protein